MGTHRTAKTVILSLATIYTLLTGLFLITRPFGDATTFFYAFCNITASALLGLAAYGYATGKLTG